MNCSVRLWARFNPDTIVMGKKLLRSLYYCNFGGSDLVFFNNMEFFFELFKLFYFIKCFNVSTSIKSSYDIKWSS